MIALAALKSMAEGACVSFVDELAAHVILRSRERQKAAKKVMVQHRCMYVGRT